jgi:hypothetical protein
MKRNPCIPDLFEGDNAWMVVAIYSSRSGTTKRGEQFFDAIGANSTGKIALKAWSEACKQWGELGPGLWGVIGRVELYQDQPQFVLSEYRRIDLEKYLEQDGQLPRLPRAYTMDIETLARPDFRERVPKKLQRELDLGNMRLEQQQRYDADPEAEIERVYQLGSLSATSGRIVSIAVHVGSNPLFASMGAEVEPVEHVFGITAEGEEQDEAEALRDYNSLMAGFDPDLDLLVGHNLLNFDLPFIHQRCLVHGMKMSPSLDLSSFKIPCVFDTMHAWWLGAKKHVSLDEMLWALGLESSKTATADGSRVFEMYYDGRLADIRDYNIRDIRATRRAFELMATAGTSEPEAVATGSENAATDQPAPEVAEAATGAETRTK